VDLDTINSILNEALITTPTSDKNVSLKSDSSNAYKPTDLIPG